VAGKYKDIVDELEVLLDGFICDDVEEIPGIVAFLLKDVEEINQKLETIAWLCAEEAYA
jgi:hypothetical protein